jgi:SAM-dependent methyltransferase
MNQAQTGTQARDAHDAAIHQWYEENAHRFEDATAIEVPFLGLSKAAQQRMNQFKLAAISSGAYVSLKGRRVLEFGAGHGRLPLTYPDMASYIGVDYSANLVALGNQRLANAGLANRASLVHGDVMSYDGAKSASDVVCSLGMLAYMPDPEAVLRRMTALAKPGGVLFVDFRCESPVYSALRRLKWAIRKPTGGITYLLPPARIEEILRTIGCTDIRIVAREFPLLAGLHARFGWTWPRALRDAMADSPLFRPLATEAWAFATWQSPQVEGR